MHATPRSTRRDFLQGKSAADALARAAEAALPSDDFVAQPAGESHLIKFSRRAMACQFEIYLNAGEYERGGEAALAALDLVDRLEDQLSVYRQASEVSEINRRAFAMPVVVEPRLFDLLALAVNIHRDTAGAYDVTAGPLSRAWGFTHRAGAIPSAEALDQARARVGSQFLELDAKSRTVRYQVPEMEINLGSIGKGYALDRCAELLETAGVHDFLLHGGNSSVLARGGRWISQRDGWSIGVRNPLRPDRRAGELRLLNRALATSGSGTQFFVHEGRRFGHILDPRSGWPADRVLSTSVLAPTAAEADALSTALYVMGPESAAEYCQAHAQIAAVMFCSGDRPGSIVRHSFGLQADVWSDAESDESN